MANAKIGIWGFPRSGKSSYLYALHQALTDATFTVAPSGGHQLRRYARSLASFIEDHRYPDPTPAEFLDYQNQNENDQSDAPADAGDQLDQEAQDNVDTIQQDVQDDLDLVQQDAEAESPAPNGGNQGGQGTIGGGNAGPIGAIDETNILKLEITFPASLNRVKQLRFVGENASRWTNQTFELYLPDHGGENWLLESNDARMQAMIKLYSEEDFKGFMFFFDPTFQWSGGSDELGINHPYNEMFSVFLDQLRNTKKNGRLESHCAVILTKTDEPRFHEYAVAGRDHAEFYPHLLAELVLGHTGFSHLRSSFSSDAKHPDRYLKCFCCSSVGKGVVGSNSKEPQDTGGLNRMRRRPEPQGILDPFLWLVSRIVDPLI